MIKKRRFKIALSYSSEKRDYVRQVAELLAKNFDKKVIFYDEWYEAELARINLDSHLQNIYYKEFDLLVPFLCSEYKAKQWCGLEWRAIQAIIKERNYENIMLLRFDDTKLPGLFSQDGYIDLRNKTPSQIANLICQRLNQNFQFQSVELNSQKIDITRLPVTQGTLWGREQELQILDESWKNIDINILCLTALGGAGKSALITKWLLNLRDQAWLKAEYVFGYSFYDREDSKGWLQSGSFIEEALKFFNIQSDTSISAWDKGKILAEFIIKKRSLLILDGLEPLQKASGEIQEQSLQSLLRHLSISNGNGLCIITSRINLSNQFWIHIDNKKVVSYKLKNLSNKSSISLLKSKGIYGKEKCFSKLAKAVHGHALSLSLLGNNIRDLYNGDLAKYCTGEVNFKIVNYQSQSIMKYYEEFLSSSSELVILYIIAVSDLSLSVQDIDRLKQCNKIIICYFLLTSEEFLSDFRKIDKLEKRRAINHLAELDLIFQVDFKSPINLNIDTIKFDCHPLVRQYFKNRFRERWPRTWYKIRKDLNKLV